MHSLPGLHLLVYTINVAITRHLRHLGGVRRQDQTGWAHRVTLLQNKRQDAYDLLAPVYHWFTEGFDTADLKEAKALLGELRR
jgi:hypothetical protein